MRRIHGGLALTCASALLLSACGDGDAVVDPTETPTATETVTDDPVGSETEDDALAAYCAVAEEMFAADGIPTADQITRYADLAPAEIRAEADIAAAALVPVGGDVVAFIATYAQDEVTEAVLVMNEFENANCGLEHDGEDPLPGTTYDLDESATRVDVVATEFTFEFGDVAAGTNSFVLTNDGAQAHHLLIFTLPEGMTAEEAVQSEEEDNGVEEIAATQLAAPGGEDEEIVTVDLEPGNYAFVCFLPDAEFTPHAFQGMAMDVTVA